MMLEVTNRPIICLMNKDLLKFVIKFFLIQYLNFFYKNNQFC